MKLTDKIHQLQLDFEIAVSPDRKLLRYVNTFILFGEKITLIDTGVSGSHEKIFDYIEQRNRSISEIDTIILSHSHPDHIGSAAEIKEITGCRVLAHELEKSWIENIDKQYKERPVPGFYNLVDRSVIIDEFLNDGQIIQADTDLSAKVIHSPGHSKGSLNLLFRESNMLFTADSIPLKNDIPNYDNYNDLLKSLNAIKQNNDFSVLLSSWTPPVLSLIDSYLLIKEGEDYLKRIDSIVKEIYSSEEKENLQHCRATVMQLGLPPFLINPLVDKSFRSHLN